MKITWIGQAGLMLEKDGFTVLIDPYLSNSIAKINPKSERRTPINEELFNVKPDVIIFTHDHLDHYDAETAERFIGKDTALTVLAPTSVWKKVRTLGGNNNYVSFNAHTSVTVGNILFRAVRAEHSEEYAIGVIINDGERKYYHTGDTLYNEDIFPDIPSDIYALFVPINGVGNNMNTEDAARFSERVGARVTVPIHYGTFDSIDPNEFKCNNKRIIELYKETEL